MQQILCNDGWGPKREVSFLVMHTLNLLNRWTVKIVLALTFLGLIYTIVWNFFKMDEAIVLLDLVIVKVNADKFVLSSLAIVMLIDLVIGVGQAIFINKCFSLSVLLRGIGKWPLYSLYIILAGILAYNIQAATGYGGGILNVFMAYLSATEILSIAKNLERCGIPIPKILHLIIHNAPKKLEKLVEETYKVGDNEEDK